MNLHQAFPLQSPPCIPRRAATAERKRHRRSPASLVGASPECTRLLEVARVGRCFCSCMRLTRCLQGCISTCCSKKGIRHQLWCYCQVTCRNPFCQEECKAFQQSFYPAMRVGENVTTPHSVTGRAAVSRSDFSICTHREFTIW